MEETLNQYVGEIRVEKLYLSCWQEFICIISMKEYAWEEMYEVIKNTANRVDE